MAHRSDLSIELVSNALVGRRLDFVVSGSIGAVEAVRMIRALRRLGADVTPWLTNGGRQFVTDTALSWAAAQATRTQFAGDASHICESDAVVIAPASTNILGAVSQGLTGTPATALIASALGQKKPVVALPAMHDSLAACPAYGENHARLRDWGMLFLSGRVEEGKQKIPDPESFADQVSHSLNQQRHAHRVVVSLGGTRGYIDAVRYVGNYSSGALGSAITEELYRLGFDTHAVIGSAVKQPRSADARYHGLTPEDMQAAIAATDAQSAVLAAAVLDYTPAQASTEKKRSGDDQWDLRLVPTPKIIAGVKPNGAKVGFKLETGLTEASAREWAERYIKKYDLTLLVANDLAKVGQANHEAWVFAAGQLDQAQHVTGRTQLAQAIAAHVVAKAEEAL